MATRTRVGIVVPTLGTRPEYLRECVDSLSQEKVYIALVGPATALKEFEELPIDLVIHDVGLSLPEAINKAVAELPSDIDYISWLGDDDRIASGSIDIQTSIMDKNLDIVATYGQCQYVDSNGDPLLLQKSGQFATKLITWGPNLVPQPGGLFRRSVWVQLGGLDTSFKQAFDTDIFLRALFVGQVRYVPKVVSHYRWHDEALSVRRRWLSIQESSRARRIHSSYGLLTNPLLDWTVRLATLIAGKTLSFRLQREKGKK